MSGVNAWGDEANKGGNNWGADQASASWSNGNNKPKMNPSGHTGWPEAEVDSLASFKVS